MGLFFVIGAVFFGALLIPVYVIDLYTKGER